MGALTDPLTTRVRAGVACALAAVALGAVAAGCGKKGPPLAPVLRVPAQVAPFEARRAGDTVFIRFKVPSANQDGSLPADVGRVEVYGYTGIPPAVTDIYKYGTLVATVDVRKPKPVREAGKPGAKKPAPAEAADEPGVDQGETVTVVEQVTPALARKVLTPAQQKAERRRVPVQGIVPAAGPAADTLPTRFYVAVGVTRGGRRGGLSARSTVPLVNPPPAIAAPTVAFDEAAVTVSWTLPPGTRRAIQAPVPAGETILNSRALSVGSPASGFNVYEFPSAGGGGDEAAKPAPAGSFVGTPLNEKPLEAGPFSDPRVEFGARRCYVVRVVDRFAALSLESATSPPACVSMIDTFAPAVPKQLAAVAGDGAISLIWEANVEKDLAGYIVLRGESPAATLEPLTRELITGTTFRDLTAKPGVRYVYAVMAVDTATPPNRSAASNRVEEALR